MCLSYIGDIIADLSLGLGAQNYTTAIARLREHAACLATSCITFEERGEAPTPVYIGVLLPAKIVLRALLTRHEKNAFAH